MTTPVANHRLNLKTAKSPGDLREEAKQLFRDLPSAALCHGAKLGRWERTADSLTIADGEAGRGIYFYFSGDASTARYYAGLRGEGRRVDVVLSNTALLVNLTHPLVAPAVCRWLTDYSASMGSPCKWSRATFQRSFWGLTTLVDVMREVLPSTVSGYVVPHVVPGCPASKQVVVFHDESLMAA